MAVMVFVPLLTPLLIGGLGRYVTEAYARRDKERITQIVSTMFPLLLGMAVLILVIGAVFSWYVDRVLTIAPDLVWDARLMTLLLVFSTTLRMSLAPFGVGMYVRQRFVLSNSIDLGVQLLRIVLLGILLFGVSSRVLWVVVATVAANVIGLVAKTVVSRRLVPELTHKFGRFRKGLVKELVSFGVWNFASNLARTCSSSADKIILNKLASAVDVASFHLGSLPYQHLVIGWIQISGPLQPVMTAMHATGNKEKMKNTFLRGGRYALWSVMIVSLPLIIYRNDLIPLYLQEKATMYANVAAVMALLLATLPFTMGNTMMWKIAYAEAKLPMVAWRRIVIEVARMALTLYLVGVKRMGAIAPAAAFFVVTVLGEFLLNMPVGLRLANLTFKRWLGETLTPGLLPSLAGAAVWIALRYCIQPSTWLSLGICAALGCVLYGIVLLAFCLNEYERNDLRRTLSRLGQRLRPDRFGDPTS